jgi:hypothetical protein
VNGAAAGAGIFSANEGIATTASVSFTENFADEKKREHSDDETRWIMKNQPKFEISKSVELD